MSFKFLRNQFIFVPDDGKEIVVPEKYTTSRERDIYICGVLCFRCGYPRNCYSRQHFSSQSDRFIFDEGWFAETDDVLNERWLLDYVQRTR